MSTISGCEIIDERLNHWGPVFKAWAKAIDRYCDSVNPIENNNVPWMFMEVSNTGILSAAAWSIGWVTLIESPGRKNGKHARTDLWIKPIDHPPEYLEAKFSRLHEVKDQLEIACSEALSNTLYEEGSQPIGVCYTNFEQAGENLSENEIENFITELKQAEPGAIAWCLPEAAREYKSDNSFRPGMALVAKRP